MKALSAADIARAKKQIEDGSFGTMFDADDALALMASHEELRAALNQAISSAMGHAYATGMAESGEEIQAQELARERKDHAETREERKRYEDALANIFDLGHNDDCIFCGLKDREAKRALELPSIGQGGG